MAIEGIQLADESSALGTGALMREWQDAAHPGGRGLRIAFETLSGGGVVEGFDVRASARGYPKGSPYLSAWRDYEATVSAKDCAESKSGGRTSWGIPLDLVGSLSSDFGGAAGKWLYSTRSHDTVTIDVSVRARWSSDVMGVGGSKPDWVSEWASAELYAGYLAGYVVKRVYYDGGSLVIEYETTWTRADDRFAIGPASYIVGDAGADDDAGEGEPIVASEVWGTVAAAGRIEVPASELLRHLRGKRVHLDLAFNPFYRPYASEVRALSGGYADVGAAAECDSCTLELAESADPYAVWLYVGDAADRGSRFGTALVKCRTATGHSSQTAVEMPAKGKALAKMRGVPLNVPLTFEAVGTTATATSAEVAVLEAPAVSARGVCVIDSAEGDSRAVVRYDQSYRVTSEPECESVRLAGRKRPSAFYGEGGSTSVEVSGVLVDDDGTGLERMVEEGDVFVRLPDGRSYRCKASVSLDWDFFRTRNVTVTGEEVGR